MYHYVYKIEDPKTNEYYFGSRSCKCFPSQDDYMGSMCTWSKEEGYDSTRHIKKILDESFSDRDKALKYEEELIRKHWKDPLNKNYVIPGQKNAFCSPGEKNQMHGKSVQFFWERKYGKEKAMEMWKQSVNKKKVNRNEDHPMFKQIFMTDEEVILKYKEGLSMKKIAELNGVSKIKIVAILDKHNVKRRTLNEQCKVRDTSITDETRRKMSECHKGKPKKSVYEYWVERYGKDIADEKMKLYKEKMSNSIKKANEKR
jgi:hypothetical protein